MNPGLDWDEFRLVKAIADARSLVGAAEALGVNHSTIFRRLAAVEAAVGARLFERSRAGYQPTSAGEEMIALATTMAESIAEFERHVAGRDVSPTGQLRVTTVDTIAVALLPPVLARFRKETPGVQLDVIVAAQTLNLSRRDADVAIRATNEPPESLVGRRICTMRWAVYALARLVEEFGPQLAAAGPWLGFGEGHAPPRARRWLEETVGPGRQACRIDSVLGMAEAAVAGVGAALLPCFLGDVRPELVRAGPLLAELDVDLWILTHADLRHSARVRAFMEVAAAELVKMRKLLEGGAGRA
ncbi:MAG TPA: LysR family transcriptional regulator [Roseiarcus sp.]|jgi:DNA-binding transcriptional LysR family regulator